MTLLLSKWVQPRTQGSLSPQKRNRLLSAMKNHGNMTVTHKKDNSSETRFKVTDYYELTDKEFQTATMNKLNKL